MHSRLVVWIDSGCVAGVFLPATAGPQPIGFLSALVEDSAGGCVYTSQVTPGSYSGTPIKTSTNLRAKTPSSIDRAGANAQTANDRMRANVIIDDSATSVGSV